MKTENYNLFFQHYSLFVNLWKGFITLHLELLDKTEEEYKILITGDINSLEKLAEKKQNVIKKISELENSRKKLIEEFNINTFSNVTTIKQLLKIFKEIIPEEETDLQKLNFQLITTIEKTQLQNKKNQNILSKSMTNLTQIKNILVGTKNYTSYSSAGKEIQFSTR